MLMISALLLAVTMESASPPEVCEDEAASTTAVTKEEPPETWGAIEPGNGFQITKTKRGDLWLSGYGLVRYIDQRPGVQTFEDHLGEEHPIDGRRDVQWHRVLMYFKGWAYSPRLNYSFGFWTVNASDSRAFLGSLSYAFNPHFVLGAGISGLPGTRTLTGSHPYWLGTDRVMADEYFRPGFTSGVWAYGAIIPGLYYNAMVGNNLSQLGVPSRLLTRDFAKGGSVWWMPTTGEFGPRGGLGDYEVHAKPATRFGISATQARENRFNQIGNLGPDNPNIRLGDSLALFDTNSLAPGVTVLEADYRLVSADAGFKWRGFFAGTEIYDRMLDDFATDGFAPVRKIHDRGFQVQTSYYIKPLKLEVYGATSHIRPDHDAGYRNSSELLGGVNYYPFDTRNFRINAQVIDVDRSPVNSPFGYYIGGQKGTTYSVATSIFF